MLPLVFQLLEILVAENRRDHLALVVGILEHSAQGGDQAVVIPQFLSQLGFRARFPIATFIRDFYPRACFAPQIQKLNDPQMARAKMLPAELAGVLRFAEGLQLPVGAFRG